MQKQAREPLEFQPQPERVVRFIQRFILGIVWAMVPFLLLRGYLRYGEIRSSTVLGIAIPIIVTVLVLVIRPRQMLKTMALPSLLATEEGVQFRGGQVTLPLIPWEEIAAIRPIYPLGLQYLQLVPRDPNALKKRLGPNWVNHWLPGGLILPVIAFGPARQLAAQLEDYRSRIASRIG